MLPIQDSKSKPQLSYAVTTEVKNISESYNENTKLSLSLNDLT